MCLCVCLCVCGSAFLSDEIKTRRRHRKKGEIINRNITKRWPTISRRDDWNDCWIDAHTADESNDSIHIDWFDHDLIALSPKFHDVTSQIGLQMRDFFAKFLYNDTIQSGWWNVEKNLSNRKERHKQEPHCFGNWMKTKNDRIEECQFGGIDNDFPNFIFDLKYFHYWGKW